MSFNFRHEICKFSATLAPLKWTASLVTSFSFWIFKVNLGKTLYAEFNENLTVCNFLNGLLVVDVIFTLSNTADVECTSIPSQCVEDVYRQYIRPLWGHSGV